MPIRPITSLATLLWDEPDSLVAGAATPFQFGPTLAADRMVAAATTIPAGSFSSAYVISTAGDYALLAGTTRTQTAGVGVSVTSTAGPVNVAIDGSLIDQASGQRAVDFANTGITGSLTVGETGLVQSFNQDTVRVNSANGTVNLTNLGQIVSTSPSFTPAVGGTNPGTGFAITYNAARGAANAATNDFTSGGVITNGSRSNTAALIRSQNGDAIRLGSHQTLVNYGTIDGAGQVNDASTNNVYNGSNGNPNTSVAQTYDVSRGVRLNQSGGVAVKVDNYGTISGSQHGLDVGQANITGLSVTNEEGGLILGRNGSGVGADTTGAGSNAVTVFNSGTIRGEYAPLYDRAGYRTIDGDGDGIDIDGGATIINDGAGVIAGSGANGNLQGQGAGGFDSNGRANQSEGISIGGGLVANGGLISGADTGIVVNNDSNADGSRSGVAAAVIANFDGATIIGQAGYAIRLENKTGTAADNDTITNYGTIIGNGAVPTGTVLRQDGSADTGTVGTLDGVTYTASDAGSARFIRGDGSAIQMGEGADTLANYGTIQGNSGRAINMEGGDDRVTLYTGSSMSGTIDGGSGTDILTLSAGSTSTTGTIAGVVNFEALSVESGTWSTADSVNYSNGITIASGAAFVITGSAGPTGAITNDGSLVVNSTSVVAFSGAIDGAGVVEQDGSGTLFLSGAKTYSGGTLLNGGSIYVNNAGGLGTGTITFGAGAQSIFFDALTFSQTNALANQIRGFGEGDSLDVANANANAATYDASTGDLTLNGTRPVSFHIGAGYSNNIFRVSSDGSTGVIVTTHLPVPPTFAPASGASAAPTYVENATAVQLIDAVSVDDANSSNYGGGTLAIGFSTGFTAGDALTLSGQSVTVSGSAVSYNGVQVATLTTTATQLSFALNTSADDDAVQAIAQAVRYASTSDNPTSVTRDFTFLLTDSDGDSTNFSRSVTVVPVNDAPAGTDGTVAATVGTLKALAVADFGSSDVDGNTLLGVKVSSLPGTGTLLYDADGQGGNAPVAVTAGQTIAAADIAAGKFLYVSGTSAGSDSFTFQVQDDGGTANGGVDLDQSPNTITLAVSAPASTARIFSTDFAAFTAAGFAPGAAASSGQLDSNVWRVVGLSDIARPAYGFTGPAGGDFGRGLIDASSTVAAVRDPVSAGVYSPTTNHALVVQPTGAELDVNGYVEARFLNGSGATATSFGLDFDWAYRNSGGRADNLQLSYSTDGANFTAVTSANFSTPTAADATLAANFSFQHETVTLDGVVAAGGYVYVRWAHLSSTGSGNRDEVGIDNVTLDAALSTTPTASVTGGSVAEGNSGISQAVFTVTRSSASGTASVDYTTQDGTARAGSDYVAQSGTVTFAAGETSKTVSIGILGDTRNEPDETFQLKLSNAQGFQTPQTTATMTILNDDSGPVAIYDIQGAGHRSQFTGLTVATGGVVTALASNGFYLQDPTGDGDISTSDGIFVFTSSAPTVAVGNRITLSGTVSEYAAANNQLSLTQLTSPTAISVVNASVALPDAVLISTDGTGRAPPTSVIDDDGLTSFDPATDGADFYESLEGMRVTVQRPLAVSTTDANGQTFVVASGGTGATGLNSRSGMTISAGDMNPETIKIFERGIAAGTHTQGDVLNDVTGVINYFGGRYELDPSTPVTTAVDAPVLAREGSLLRGDLTHLSYASFNVENLGPVAAAPVTQAAVDARYAAHATEVVTALNSPDVIGLQEIQDANGENAGGNLSGAASAQKLIDAIAAAGGPSYAYVEVAPSANNSTGGVPEGNIRNGFLYNTSRVSYVDGSAHLLTAAAYSGSRQPLVADFKFNGQLFTAIDVHSTSRGGSDPLYSSNQPPVNAGDASRTAQAQGVADYVNGVLANDPTHQFVVNGDFNGFYFETALQTLAPESGGALQNLYYKLPAEERYSYYFDGYYQTLDHIIVSNSLYAGTQFDVVHYNAGYDASAQSTDHDQPVAAIGLARSGGTATAVADGFTTTAASLFYGTVLANDTGGDASLAVTALNGDAAGVGQYVRLASGALLFVNAGGGFVYDPDGAYSGLAGGASATDQFSYTLTGGSTATVTIAVSGVTTPAPDANGHINGTAGNDVFGGTPFVDYFDLSQGGNDTVSGGAGDDTFYFGGTFTAGDRVNGGSGTDQIVLHGDYSGANALLLAANTLRNVEVLHLDGGFSYGLTTVDGNVATNALLTIDAAALTTGDQLVFNGAAEADGHFTVLGGAGADQITGGTQADLLLGGIGADTILGGFGDDVIYGNQDNDVLYGNQGNDTIYGGQGNDTAFGGQGDDLLFGNLGDDALHGNLGNDVLNGGAGTNLLDGGDGTDTASYADAVQGVSVSLLLAGQAQATGMSTDTLVNIENLTGSAYADTLTGDANANLLTGGFGADLLTGGLGDDVLYGNQDNDVLYGNQGNDTLYGGQGDDTLYGGQGDDVLVGGVGNDLIQGGVGRDVMTGGTGADIFRFVTANDSPMSTPDLVTDFQSGTDKIDLSAVHTSGADLFVIGSNGTNTLVDVDLGGNGSIDLRIEVVGSVAASDIIWTNGAGSVAHSDADPAVAMAEIVDRHIQSAWQHADFDGHYAMA